jgi:hypothetical protein
MATKPQSPNIDFQVNLPWNLLAIILAMLVLPARHMDVEELAILGLVCLKDDTLDLSNADMGI